jgi:hypothetical protein
MRRWMFGLGALVGTTALVMACSVGNDFDFGLCAGPPAGGDGGDGNVDGEGGVKPPEGCDDKADPKDSPRCVASDFGIFVSPDGKPDAAGTKEAPVNTIAAGLSKIGAFRRIYVCEGTYAERVVLKAAVSLYGGFSCADWTHTGVKPLVGNAEPGYALDVQSVAGAFEIADLEFAAASGTEAAPNSVAARFVGTAGAVLRRVKLSAKDGAPGKSGDAGADGNTVKHTDFTGTINPFDPAGSPGSAGQLGPGKTCKCPNAPAADSTTAGASGGAAPTGAGSKGDPSALPPTAANDGAGGAASAPNCGVGDGTGHNGADRAQAGSGGVPTRLGALESNNWKPQAGGDGSTGLPGQGGGGGSGQSTGAGSGGACGGCGGFGGKAGGGAGASIALLAISSPVRFTGEFLTGAGGRGGDGGDGGGGGDGGFGGVRTTGNGCNGGDGGKGGKGGAGSGGAGGLSVGVLSSGDKPTTDGSTFTLGKAGDGGDGLSTNSGPPGVRAETASVEVVSTKPSM